MAKGVVCCYPAIDSFFGTGDDAALLRVKAAGGKVLPELLEEWLLFVHNKIAEAGCGEEEEWHGACEDFRAKELARGDEQGFEVGGDLTGDKGNNFCGGGAVVGDLGECSDAGEAWGWGC